MTIWQLGSRHLLATVGTVATIGSFDSFTFFQKPRQALKASKGAGFTIFVILTESSWFVTFF